MIKKLEFKDLGFKLAVINELMYNKEVLNRDSAFKFLS